MEDVPGMPSLKHLSTIRKSYIKFIAAAFGEPEEGDLLHPMVAAYHIEEAVSYFYIFCCMTY